MTEKTMANPNEEGRAQINRFLDSIDEWTVGVLEDVRNEQVKEIFHDCICVGVTGRQSISESNKLPKKIKSAIVDSTPQYVREVLTEALDEQRFDEKFQILHDLKEKYKDRTEDAWRPPNNAVDHMRNARVKLRESQLKQLQCLISIKKSSVAGLKDKIRTSSAIQTVPKLMKELEVKIESVESKSAIFNEKVTSLNDLLCETMDNHELNST